MKLRKAHINQLLSYLQDCESTGWYYGNKHQFIKRHKELKAWLEELLEDYPVGCVNRKRVTKKAIEEGSIE